MSRDYQDMQNMTKEELAARHGAGKTAMTLDELIEYVARGIDPEVTNEWNRRIALNRNCERCGR